MVAVMIDVRQLRLDEYTTDYHCWYCSQAVQHKSCVDAIVCPPNHVQYQLHVIYVSLANEYMGLCDNDTWSGCTDFIGRILRKT